jgi:ATP/maltotriose-dependent transcriptional regulator MalT
LWLGVWYYHAERNPQQALEATQESLAVFTQAENQRGIAEATLSLVYVLIKKSDYHEARRMAQQGLISFQRLGIVWGIAMGFTYCGKAALGLGDYAEAGLAAYQALTIAAKYRLVTKLLDTLVLVAQLWLDEGKSDRAMELIGLVDQRSSTIDPFYSGLTELLSKLEAVVPSEQISAAVQRGRALDFDETVTQVLGELQHRINAEEAQNSVIQPLIDPLTERELEILRLIATGLSNQAIADQLFLALGTVRWYAHDIYSKLGVGSRTQAVARARELSLLN